MILTPPEAVKVTKEIWIDGPNADPNKVKLNFKAKTYGASLALLSCKDKRVQHKTAEIKCSSSNLSVDEAKANSFESLECLDRQLLRQLDKQDMDAIDAVFKLDSHSRPISLLSVNSGETSSASMSTSASVTTFTTSDSCENKSPREDYNLSFRQKLEDLKASTDQMVFRQSCKQMESLHKTLESFLSLDPSSRLSMMKPVKSTVLVAADKLKTSSKEASKPKECAERELVSSPKSKDECLPKGLTTSLLFEAGFTYRDSICFFIVYKQS